MHALRDSLCFTFQYIMICQIKRMIMLVCALNLSVLVLLSQYSSKNNYEGAWETSSSWIPTWAVPQTSIGVGITINGYITANESLTFTGIANLIVNDTLVVYGDLTLDNNTSVTINGQGILIVWGNLYINNSASIMVNKYMIVTGNIIKGGSVDQGSFSENSPDKVFIGGS